VVNKKQELIEAIDKLQDSQVVKFNNRVVDLSMSLHRSELRLILKEDYQDWNDNAIDALFESVLNEGKPSREAILKSKITNPKSGRKIQVSTGLSYGKGHPAYPPAKGAFTKAGYSEEEAEKVAKATQDAKAKKGDKKKDDEKGGKETSDAIKRQKANKVGYKDYEWSGATSDEIEPRITVKDGPEVIPTKGPEDITNRANEERDKIFSGEKTGKGTIGTTAQEECANIGRDIAARKDFKEPPPLAEQIYKEVKEKYPQAIGPKPAPYQSEEALMKVCKKSSAGARTMNVLRSNDKWGYAEEQPPGFPVNTTDNIIVRDTLLTKLKEAEESGDEEAIKHYKRELYFYQKKATDKSVTGKEGDADTMIIYQDKNGRTRTAYVTNKQTVNDQMSSSTINGTKVSIIENAGNYFDDPEGEDQESVQLISDIATEQHDKASKFNTIYTDSVKAVADDEEKRQALREPGVSKALGKAVNIDDKGGKKEYHTGGTDEKYTKEAQKAPEVQAKLLGLDGPPNNDTKSKEYKEWKKGVNKEWKNKENEFTSEETMQAVIDTTGTGGLNGVGSGTGGAPYSMIKALKRTKKVRKLMKDCIGGDESRVKECAKKVSNQRSATDKDAILFGGAFDADDIEAIYNSKELEELEQGEQTRGENINGMYDETTARLREEDKKWAEKNGVKDVPPKNGPHVKSYVKGFLDRTHISDYMSGDVDGRVMAEFGNTSLSPAEFRRALAKTVDFPGDPDDIEALEEYIMDRVVPSADNQELIYVCPVSGEQRIIGVDSHTTSGRESKVRGMYGADLKKNILSEGNKPIEKDEK